MLEFQDEPTSSSAAAAESAERRIALSIKQPWATLVVHGLKTIELRTWRPKRLGEIYIHAGAVPDDSEEAWAKLPTELASFAKLRRGVVGKATVASTKRYDSLDSFRLDGERHLAPESWFTKAGLIGWVLESPETVPFEPRPGNLRLFRL